MERYVQAVYLADVPTLRGLFHPRASMSGFLGDDLLVGTPEPFFDDLDGRPSMAEQGDPYEATIIGVEVMGRAATATLVERGFFGKFELRQLLPPAAHRWRVEDHEQDLLRSVRRT